MFFCTKFIFHIISFASWQVVRFPVIPYRSKRMALGFSGIRLGEGKIIQYFLYPVKSVEVF